MYVLMDNLIKKMYFKGIDKIYNRESYTYYIDNALKIETLDEARMLADMYNLSIKNLKE